MLIKCSFRRTHDHPRTHPLTSEDACSGRSRVPSATAAQGASNAPHRHSRPQQDPQSSTRTCTSLPYPIAIEVAIPHTRPRPKTAEAVISPEHAPGCPRSTRTGTLWAIAATSTRAIDARPCSLANAIRVSQRCTQPATGHTRSQRGTTYTQAARFVNHDGSRLTAVDGHQIWPIADCACRTFRPTCDLWSSNPSSRTGLRPRASAALAKF